MPPSGSAAAPRPQRPGPGRGRRILRCRHSRHRRTARGPHGEAGGPGLGDGRDARDQMAMPRQAAQGNATPLDAPPTGSICSAASVIPPRLPLPATVSGLKLSASRQRRSPLPLPLAAPFASDLVRAQVVCALRVTAAPGLATDTSSKRARTSPHPLPQGRRALHLI